MTMIKNYLIFNAELIMKVIQNEAEIIKSRVKSDALFVTHVTLQ